MDQSRGYIELPTQLFSSGTPDPLLKMKNRCINSSVVFLDLKITYVYVPYGQHLILYNEHVYLCMF